MAQGTFKVTFTAPFSFYAGCANCRPDLHSETVAGWAEPIHHFRI